MPDLPQKSLTTLDPKTTTIAIVSAKGGGEGEEGLKGQREREREAREESGEWIRLPLTPPSAKKGMAWLSFHASFFLIICQYVIAIGF